MKQRNVALILLFNDQKEILLQHRDEDADLLPGHWGFFGGEIEKGETPLEAVSRETQEELSYQLKNPHQIMTQNFADKDNGYYGTKHVFSEKYNPTQTLEQHEGQGMKWVDLIDTKQMKIIDHDREILDSIKGKY
ncbi:NUDIX domain-containing protein [Patescibacteria group bacterium]|nr:NUDIX domain-containing protein [Patescibacteria group bacterium]